ncbi:hypothetical protein F5887DRAFT_460000 [Amanita rubescens]|nr:hypothetical protein F5887DRAFT_460000 [Amanita rubescens]
MSKIISRSPVLPRSLFLTGGLTMPGDRDLIGKGTFGLVFKGEHAGKAVALKALYKTRKNVDVCREALMWRSLHHKFVLPFLGIYENEAAGRIFLVSPYMTNGTLSQWRKKQAPSPLDIEKRV